MGGAPEFDALFQEQLRTLLAWRRDVRHFQRRSVPRDIIDHLLALACLAPSVGLSQPWRFVLVEDEARRTAIRDNFRAENAAALADYAEERARRYALLKLSGLEEAPVHLAVFTEASPAQGHGLGRRTMPESVDHSVVMAIHTFWLAARSLGIGVGWVSILDPERLRRTLDASDDWRFVGYLCVGYPQFDSEVPELEARGWEHRRPAGEFVFRR
jgi:5,6-dimethylbenzimidazole synthase